MAATEKIARPKQTSTGIDKPVFWASSGHSGKQETFVPGVNTLGNMRPKVKGGKTKEVRAYVPVKQPTVETTDSHGTKTSLGMTSDISTIETYISNVKSKQVSLRDLCVEDKKRVANLIKELARVVEEKESAELNLATERNHYQEQILKLVGQQETVLKEREDVQNKLLEYQNLIVKLQQEQQLLHLKRQQELQRRLQQKNPAIEKTVDMPIPRVSRKAAKSQKPALPARTDPSERNDSHEPRSRPSKSVPQLVPRAKTQAHDDLDENSHTSDEEDEAESPIELPSQNLYMNLLEDSGVEEFSTQAHPAVSPSSGTQQPRANSYRPFTAMIDRELAKQQAALKSMDHLMSPDHSSQHRRHKTTGRNVERALNAEASKEGKTSLKTNVNMEDGVISPDKRVGDGNVGEKTGKTDFVLSSHPFVSPEKAEIFSRFMHSQSKGDHQHRYDEFQQSEVFSRTDGVSEGVDLKGGRKQRKKKQPPASYGVLYPPVMSSTQKSSEIGDYVNSTINSDRKVMTVKRGQGSLGNKGQVEEKDDSKEDVDVHKPMSRHEDEKSDFEDNVISRLGSVSNTRKSKQAGKPRVEFSDQLSTSKDFQANISEADDLVGVDPEYLSYYKNLSGTERKKELLKQRTKLLEEQNKLRKVLAEQENRLMMKQADVMTRRETMQGVDKEDKATTSKVSESLEEMELRLAQKELAIRKEKELLEQRRKEQTLRHGSGLKSIDTDIGQSQGRNHCPKRPGYEGLVKIRMSPGNKLDGDNEILNKALILPKEEDAACRDVATDDKNIPLQMLEAGNVNGIKVVPERKRLQSEHPNNGQELTGGNLDGKPVTSASDHQREDDLARRLEYSFHSDADQPNRASGQKKDTLKSEVVSNVESHEGKVDVGTSMSFAHLDPNVSNARNVENVDAQDTKQGTDTKHWNNSPGDKTMAVIEIINSLNDLDDLLASNDSSVPTESLMIKGKQEANNKKAKILTTKSHSKYSTSKQDLIKPHEWIKRLKPVPAGCTPKSSGQRSQFPSFPLKPTAQHEKFGYRHDLGSNRFPVQHVEDSELDFFHLPQFREERLEGCRRLANRDTDDDSDDITCEYDDNDDSNLDDIVNALSTSFSTNEEDEGKNRGGRKVFDSDWYDGFTLEPEGHLDPISVKEMLNFNFDGVKRKAGDDNDILEEIFFVRP